MVKKLVVLAFVVSLLVSFSSVAKGDVIKLKFANYFPPTHMNSVMMGKYCEELNKKLAGKVEVTQYTGGTLLTAPKMAAGVASGVADIGLSHCSYSRGRFPVMEIMEAPLGFPSSWIASHVAMEFYDKFKPKEWGAFHALMFSTSPPNVVQTVKKPVKTMEDMKGMKIRGTGRIGDTVKALGAAPMPIETVDLYEALRRGVVDGTYTPLETLKGFKFGEVQKYASATWKVGSVFQFYVVMNKRKWDSLPTDAQKIITEFSKEFLERWAVEWNKIDIEGREYFIKLGGQVLPVSDAEQAKMVKAVEPVIADYKKDLVSKGYKAAEVDSWVAFIKERIEYWTAQEKAQKIPTAYQY
ncbi:MAG: C4-dicarboxylate ABC transporter substrate-binding protein [Syntrophus sp. (in: bacteria)]|nr:C4-dicarboxylate ABC transporter substrate-binding protein [Syntrophus sp. (in: bacteria)]